MVTTVGTESDLKALVRNFIILEHDAIAAYEACIDRLEAPQRKQKVEGFRQDHLRHLDELKALAARIGADAPGEGDMKEMLTTGKVTMAGMMGGDGAVLRAMASNESDTVSAYDSGSSNTAVPDTDRALFTAALEDERRHKAWMEAEADAA